MTKSSVLSVCVHVSSIMCVVCRVCVCVWQLGQLVKL